MAFVNEYRHTLDAKNRIFIPAKFREELGDTFYITRKIATRSLAVYSEAEWDKMTERINALPDSSVLDIKEFLFSKTISVSPDAQGRVMLTPPLVSYAEIDKSKSAVIVGVGDHIQIWSAPLWDEHEEKRNMADLFEKLKQLGL